MKNLKQTRRWLDKLDAVIFPNGTVYIPEEKILPRKLEEEVKRSPHLAFKDYGPVSREVVFSLTTVDIPCERNSEKFRCYIISINYN